MAAFFCSNLFLSGLALAAAVPPTPNVRKGPATWMGYGLMFLFFAAVLLISIMPSKRGHQD
jgi:NADH:ubiquinone oxidoreductase subunit H